MANSDQSPTIHILGLGNLGKLFAHSLTTTLDPAPITILTHRPGLPYAFAQHNSSISLLRHGQSTSTPPGSITISPMSLSDNSLIKHLIVTTKAAATAPALQPLVESGRLGKGSTLLFTQNGMGVIDSVNTLFPEPRTRPNYLTAIVVHGVFSTDPFTATHAGVANLKIGHSSNGDERRSGIKSDEFPGTAKWMLKQIVEAEALVATEVQPTELVAVQLEKLIVNACINPLTVIFNCINGGLLNPRVIPLRKALCEEAGAVFLRYLEVMTGLDDNLERRFAPQALQNMVEGVLERVKENKSSMYQDVAAGRETEIQYINAWFVRKAEEYGLDASTHEKLVEMVEGGNVVGMDDIAELFPKSKES